MASVLYRTLNWSCKLTGDNVSGVAYEPVAPVEECSLGGTRVGAEQSHDWLDEAEEGGERAEQGVKRGGLTHPTSYFYDDEHRAGQGQQPHDQHEEPVPLKHMCFVVKNLVRVLFFFKPYTV